MEGVPQPPPIVAQIDQQIQDAEHIRLLVIFHYILAGLTGLMACIPILHVVSGFFMLSGGFPSPSSAPPAGAPDVKMIGWLFVIIGGVAVLIGWTAAVLVFFAGKSLSERRSYNFIFVMACINCLSVPVGTALGVFTIVVLQRPSVKGLFEFRDKNTGPHG